jgi:hypothetical protein
VYIIIVSFDTKLDFLDIAHLHFLWYRLFYLVYVLLRCLYSNIYIVQSADMHVSAFYASSVQLDARLDYWIRETLVFISHELALTKACGTTQ